VTSLFKVEISGELLSQVLMVLQQESLPRMQCIITNAMTSCSNSPVVSAAPVQLEEARFVVQLLYGLTGTVVVNSGGMHQQQNHTAICPPVARPVGMTSFKGVGGCRAAATGAALACGAMPGWAVLSGTTRASV
jgi:hypothetical protein